MKKMIVSFTLMIIGVFALQGLNISSVGAQFDPLEKPCADISNDDDAKAICEASNAGTTSDPVNGSGGVIADIANLLAFVGGIIAVFIIVIAGITMMLSGGDPGKVTNSRNAIIYAAIGLVVIVLARTIVVFIFSRIID